MQVSLSYLLNSGGSHDFDLDGNETCSRNTSSSHTNYRSTKSDEDSKKIHNTKNNTQNNTQKDTRSVKNLTTYSWFAYLNSIDETHFIYVGSWNEKESLTILNNIFVTILNNPCYLKPMRHMICKHSNMTEEKLKKWDVNTVKKHGFPYFKFFVDWKYKCDMKKNNTLNPNEAVHLFDKFLMSSQMLKTKSRKELMKLCESCYPNLYNHCKSSFAFKSAIVKMILEQELLSMEKQNQFFDK